MISSVPNLLGLVQVNWPSWDHWHVQESSLHILRTTGTILWKQPSFWQKKALRFPRSGWLSCLPYPAPPWRPSPSAPLACDVDPPPPPAGGKTIKQVTSLNKKGPINEHSENQHCLQHGTTLPLTFPMVWPALNFLDLVANLIKAVPLNPGSALLFQGAQQLIDKNGSNNSGFKPRTARSAWRLANPRLFCPCCAPILSTPSARLFSVPGVLAPLGNGTSSWSGQVHSWKNIF